MNTSAAHAHPTHENEEIDYNIVALWTSLDITRWIAGAIAGAIAACIAMAVAGLIATSQGYEFVFPIKLLGTALVGREATAYGYMPGILAGLIVLAVACVGWGIVFGHFVRTNKFLYLLGMGFAWGAFSWVFTWNLFLHSVKAIVASNIPPGPAFATCFAYGFGMMSIAIVDKAIRHD